MSIEVKVPMLPESVSEASMLTWHKKVGDEVEQGEILVDLETDKVVLEVPAPESGVLLEIKKEAGDIVTADDIIAVLGDEKEKTSSDDAKSEAPKSSDSNEEEPSKPKEEAAKSEEETPKSNEANSKPKEETSNSSKNNEGAKNYEGKSSEFKITVPVLPESVSEATVQAWHKNVGDTIEEGENLVDLETDKVVLEVPASKSGVIKSIEAEVGDNVVTEQILAVISDSSSESDAEDSASATTAEDKQPSSAKSSEDKSSDNDEMLRTSPAARMLMEEENISKEEMREKTQSNRITKQDVNEAIAKKESSSDNSKPVAPKPESQNKDKNQAQSSSHDGEREEKREPMTRIRQTIAKRLVESQQSSAMLTTFNEVDLSQVMALRSKYKDSFQDKHGVKLGFMSFFVKACTEGLQKYPVINAYVDGKDILYHNYCDVGIAVSSPRGLVVPVIRSAEHKSFAQIESDIVAYGQKAKNGTLSMDEMTGGTFTITNGGIFGSMLSTPIINPPQSAILGMHAINERAVVIDKEIVIRPMMYLALSYDHRIIDGAEAVRFLVDVKNKLEDPGRLLLSV